MKAQLVLEDGRVFAGESFGAEGTRIGEVCFNTAMTGYQEVLTDPSYYGQIVAMTYPLIGNYGINEADGESAHPQVKGFVIEELSELPSSWRSQTSLPDYLAKHEIVGLQGIDTRALTRHLRERGAMKSCLTTEDLPVEEARRRAVEGEGVIGMDYVRVVTTPDPYDWDPDDQQSRRWELARASGMVDPDTVGLPPARYHIVAYDYGLKRNILRRLRQHGFKVRVVPAGTTASEVLALNPDGVFLSPGPGDPSALDYVHRSVRELLGKKPIFGICLGHQMLSYAFGGKTYKLKFGHHGGNQPVQRPRRPAGWTSPPRTTVSRWTPESLPAGRGGDPSSTSTINTVEGIAPPHPSYFQRAIPPGGRAGTARRAAFFSEQFGKLIDDSR